MALGLALGAVALWAPAMAAPSGPVTHSVGRSASEVQTNGDGFAGSIDWSGGYVVFASTASNIIAGDTNHVSDVFMRGRVGPWVHRISVSSAEAQANGPSEQPVLAAANIRFVAFVSSATNLVRGDTNGVQDVFVRDRLKGQTHRVSVATGGAQANGPSGNPRISADGRYVVFTSDATNLVPGDTNGVGDVFLVDTLRQVTGRVTVSSVGVQANGETWSADVSEGGGFVVFASHATNLVAGDTNGVDDVFLWTRATGKTIRVSVAPNGDQVHKMSGEPVISSNGLWVAFDSASSSLAAYDLNGQADVFVWNRLTHRTQLISLSTGGRQGHGPSGGPGISRDGRFVAFASWAPNLVAGDTNGMEDIFLHDRALHRTIRVSVSTGGAQGNGPSARPDVSAGGHWVLFDSLATNLVPADTNRAQDVFVRGRLG